MPDLMLINIFSLLHRYDLLYSIDSLVVLEKVSFNESTISLELKAQHAIPAGCPILSTSTSMSSNLILARLHGISVIKSVKGQNGLMKPQLMLGPL
jgi:hypothetical protein